MTKKAKTQKAKPKVAKPSKARQMSGSSPGSRPMVAMTTRLPPKLLLDFRVACVERELTAMVGIEQALEAWIKAPRQKP